CLGRTCVGSAGRRGFPDSRAAAMRGHRVPVPPAPQGRAVHAVGPTARPVRGRAWARAVGRSVRGRPGRRGRRRGGCGAWGVRRSRGAKAASLPSGRRVVAAVAGGERLTEVGSVGGEGVHRSKPFAPGVEVWEAAEVFSAELEKCPIGIFQNQRKWVLFASLRGFVKSAFPVVAPSHLKTMGSTRVPFPDRRGRQP